MAIELIAEVSSNHGGDRGLMEAFIARYAEAGADWVKFQSYQVKTLRPGDPQRDWLAQAELSDEDHWFLKETCAKYGTKFLTTVFHHSRVPFLASLGLEAIKVGSGEAAVLADVVKGFSWKVFVSTGLTAPTGFGHVTMRCVSRYPAPRGYAAPIAALGYAFPWERGGWSDHCIGLDVAQTAICAGARYIEKHVSLPEQRREKRSWEATLDEFRELRQFADDDPVVKYVGRWQHADTDRNNAL